MSPPGVLVAIAVLLAWAGLRELAAGVSAVNPRLARDGGRLARTALRLGLPERIASSGLESRLPLSAVLLGKCAGAAAGGLVASGAAPAAPGHLSLLVAVGLPAAGFFLPDALLERRARLRKRRLVGALPDACDLLAVAAAAGRGPASGFAELSCGRPLAAALRSLRERVPGGEIAALCAAIERSRRYGSPLAEQLRRQSSALRSGQRRAVEERAARAAPKIQLVVALILVPSVLLMITAALIANADVLLSGF